MWNSAMEDSSSNSCYFKMCLSNKDIEDHLPESEVESSASLASIALQQEVDLNNYIHFKSLSAEMSLDDFSVSSLPLTFSKSEKIQLSMNIPVENTHGNGVITQITQKDKNNKQYNVQMQDFSTTSHQDTLDYLNGLLTRSTNLLTIMRYSECVCDLDLYEDSRYSHLGTAQLSPEGIELPCLSEEDIGLLVWYTECSIIIRLSLHQLINKQLKDDKTSSTWDRFMSSVKVTLPLEEKIIGKSNLFKAKTNRKAVVTRLIKFAPFYKKFPWDDSSDGQKAQKQIEAAVLSNVTRYLVNNRFIEMDGGGALTDDSITMLESIRKANFHLLHQAKTILSLLKIEESKTIRTNSQINRSMLLSLSLDHAKKCIFETYPNLFLAPDKSTFTVSFENQAAYVLGQEKISDKTPKALVIGPLQAKPATATTTTTTTTTTNDSGI